MARSLKSDTATRSADLRARMAPTNTDQEIEGRPYKDYDYSPVPASASSTSGVYLPTTLPNVKKDTSNESQCVYHQFQIDMAEKGSKTLQYLAATAGESSSFLIFNLLQKHLNRKNYFLRNSFFHFLFT